MGASNLLCLDSERASLVLPAVQGTIPTYPLTYTA
jgi:hypothetical protein